MPQSACIIRFTLGRGEGHSAEKKEYAHSSAKFYLTGEHGSYKVMSYTELADVDLSAGL